MCRENAAHLDDESAGTQASIAGKVAVADGHCTVADQDSTLDARQERPLYCQLHGHSDAASGTVMER